MNGAATEKELRALVEANRSDAAALAALDRKLQAIAEPWAGPLRLKVIALKRALGLAQHWGAAFGLPRPDGRPLYEYRLTTATFATLQAHLQAKMRGGGFVQRTDKALFVLWAAEWFRRGYKGGTLRWEDVGNAIGSRRSQEEWRELTDAGLRMRGLSPTRIDGVTYRLLSLARQGGFPIAAIEDGGNAWAAAYLGRLVGILLYEGAWTPELAHRHAEALGTTLPATWRSPDFYVLAADLAAALVALRRRAQDSGALGALAPSAWLDAHEPDWRDRLPLAIDTAAARRVVDGLMRVAAARGSMATVRLIRLMVRSGDGWQSRLQFDLDGAIPTIPGVHPKDWSRLRLFAAGEFARYVPGQLAILEPDDKEGWLSAPSRSGATAFDVPLEALPMFEVRSDRQRAGDPFPLPGGSALTGPFLICRAGGADDDEDRPATLIVVGSSSGKYQMEPLFLFAPSGWDVTEGTSERCNACMRPALGGFGAYRGRQF